MLKLEKDDSPFQAALRRETVRLAQSKNPGMESRAVWSNAATACRKALRLYLRLQLEQSECVGPLEHTWELGRMRYRAFELFLERAGALAALETQFQLDSADRERRLGGVSDED